MMEGRLALRGTREPLHCFLLLFLSLNPTVTWFSVLLTFVMAFSSFSRVSQLSVAPMIPFFVWIRWSSAQGHSLEFIFLQKKPIPEVIRQLCAPFPVFSLHSAIDSLHLLSKCYLTCWPNAAQGAALRTGFHLSLALWVWSHLLEERNARVSSHSATCWN